MLLLGWIVLLLHQGLQKSNAGAYNYTLLPQSADSLEVVATSKFTGATSNTSNTTTITPTGFIIAVVVVGKVVLERCFPLPATQMMM